MAIEEVRIENVLLAKLITSDDWKEGLCFFSNESDFIQVGTWHYSKGKELLAHIHNKVDRMVSRTQEVIFVKNGSIKAMIYDFEGNHVKDLIAKKEDTLILLNGGHGYIILENDTQVLEIKNGPYLGAEIDRRRI